MHLTGTHYFMTLCTLLLLLGMAEQNTITPYSKRCTGSSAKCNANMLKSAKIYGLIRQQVGETKKVDVAYYSIESGDKHDKEVRTSEI